MILSTSLREIPRLKRWELGNEAIVLHVNVVPIGIMSGQECLMKGAVKNCLVMIMLGNLPMSASVPG